MVPFNLSNKKEEDIVTEFYPGNIGNKSYKEMFEDTRKQCMRFECKFKYENSVKISFNEEKEKFFVKTEKNEIFFSEWLIIEKMENVFLDENVEKAKKFLMIDFDEDFTVLCGNGCIAFKQHQLIK